MIESVMKTLGVDNYGIEQQKTKEDVISFLNMLHKNARQVAIDTAHGEIAYCRGICGTRHGKDYTGEGDDDETYDEHGLQDTRRFRGSMVSQKINQMARKQTRQKPKIYIRVEGLETPDAETSEKLAKFGGPDGFAKALQRIYDDWWERNNADGISYRIVKKSHEEGIAFTSSYWDEERNNNKGDLVWKQFRPERAYPEPGCVTIDECDYFFVERVTGIRRAVAEYGESIFEAIKNNTGELKEGLLIDGQDNDDAMRTKVTIVDAIFRDSTSIYLDKEDEKITEKQHDRINEQIDKLEEDTLEDYSDVRPRQIMLYPNGRHFTFIDTTLLADRPNPFEFNPWGKYTPNPDAFLFWGEPTTRNLAPPQETFDKIIQIILRTFYANGLPKAFIKDGEMDEEELAEQVGQYIKVKSTTQFNQLLHYVQGQNVAGDGFNLAGLMRTVNEDVSAVHGASEGRGTGIRSGRQAIQLSEQTHEYLSQPAREWEIFLKAEAMKHITLLYKYVGEGWEYEHEDDRGNKVVGKLPMALSEIDAIIDVVVSPGSSLPEDRESRANRALMLHEADPVVFHSEWLVKELGYENDPMITSPALQYQRMKQKIAQMIMESPEQAQAMVQQGQIDPELYALVMAQLQQEQMQGQQGQQGTQGRPEQ